MRVYADRSFIARLLIGEIASKESIAVYREAGRPKLFLLPLHELEVTNSICHQSFRRKSTAALSDRKSIARDRDAALSKFRLYVTRGIFTRVSLDAEAAHQIAMELALNHTERLGTRTLDLLHVANAIALKSELFLTADQRQGDLARAAGLQVRV